MQTNIYIETADRDMSNLLNSSCLVYKNYLQRRQEKTNQYSGIIKNEHNKNLPGQKNHSLTDSNY